MKSLAYVAARQLKQIVLVEFLEHRTLQLDKLCVEQKLYISIIIIYESLRIFISRLTLFDIIIVSSALLLLFIATFRVVAWKSTSMLCKTIFKKSVKEPKPYLR